MSRRDNPRSYAHQWVVNPTKHLATELKQEQPVAVCMCVWLCCNGLCGMCVLNRTAYTHARRVWPPPLCAGHLRIID